MKASEYIAALQALIAEVGDLEIKQNGASGVLGSCSTPKLPTAERNIRYMAILSKREHVERYFGHAYDAPEKKGEKVIAI